MSFGGPGGQQGEIMRTRRFLVVGLALAAMVSACSSDTSDTVARSTGTDQSDVVSGTSSPSSTESEPTTDERTDIEILEYGFAQLPDEQYSLGPKSSYAVTVQNPNPTAWVAQSVSLNIAFYDDGGTLIKSESPSISLILPGQTAAVGTAVDLGGIARMEVQAKVGRWEEIDSDPGEFTITGLNMQPQQYGGADINGVIQSSFSKDLDSIKVTVVFRDEAGQLAGGTFTYVDFVPASGQAAFTVSTFSDVPGGWTPEAYAEITSLTLFSS
jgi:hypothetical protein